jgi:hypothetical protein
MVSVPVPVPLYGAVLVRLVQVLPPLLDTCHWQAGSGDPAVVTLKVAVLPLVTV